MAYYHLQGYAQLLQTVIVMFFALLNMATYARKAYSRRGWWVRLLAMSVTFVILGWADRWVNEGAGAQAGDDDLFGSEFGTSVHYVLLVVVLIMALTTFLATFRATNRRDERSRQPVS